MAEVVKRTRMIPYRGFEPKVSSMMDPKLVEHGPSKAKELNIPTKSRNQVEEEGANGNPYTGHNGEDTVGRWDEKIYVIPCLSGRVKLVSFNDIRGHWVEYGNNRVTVRQCHFKSLAVKAGQLLTDDTLIGIEGSTGQVSGKHLHTSIIIDGKYVDPHYYLTGELQLPDELPASKPDVSAGKQVYADTDPYEYTLDKPESWVIDTSVKKGLRIRRRPGVNFDQVGSLGEKMIVEIDRRADFPDGQKWGRLKDKPWHWVCIFDPDMQDGRGEWLLLRK